MDEQRDSAQAGQEVSDLVKPKYYVFAMCSHEESGGLHDLQGTFDTLDEAEQSLYTMNTERAPFGYWEYAHIATINSSGELYKVRDYANRVDYAERRSGKPRWAYVVNENGYDNDPDTWALVEFRGMQPPTPAP